MSTLLRLLHATAALAALGLSSVAAQEPPPAVQPPPAGLNPLSQVDKSTLNGFRERPLFTPSRRAPQAPDAAPEPLAEAEAAPPEAAPQPNLRLTGVVEGPEDAVAMVQDLDSNTVSQLRLGDMLNGWLVTSIDPVALRLTLGEQEGEYRLFDPSRSPDAAAAGEPQN